MADRLTPEERDALARYDGPIKVKRPPPANRPAPANHPARIHTARPALKVRDRVKPKAGPGPLPVQRLLEWAFAIEHVRLVIGGAEEFGGRGFGLGMEFLALQRGELGAEIDTSIGVSEPHADAESIAAAVRNLTGACGGAPMAIKVAEYARACLAPDWMPGAVARCVPREWRNGKGGQKARTEVVRRYRFKYRGKMVEREDRWCPVTYDPHPRQIEGARNFYVEWWLALSEIRRRLAEMETLAEVAVTDVMPPREPWVGGGHL